MDESGNALALKIIDLYEEKDSLKEMINSYTKDLAKVSERSYKRDGLLEAYRSFYRHIRKAVTSNISCTDTIKTIENAVRSMQGIDAEYEKMLDAAGIKRLGGE